MKQNHSNSESVQYDSTYLHARREIGYILLAWLVCVVWTIGYCYFTGYRLPSDEMKITLGMPSWIFWGVLVPWILATVFTIWFSLFVMADDPLSEKEESGNES